MLGKSNKANCPNIIATKILRKNHIYYREGEFDVLTDSILQIINKRHNPSLSVFLHC